MKKLWLILLIAIICYRQTLAQDYVNVTFRHYPIADKVARAYLPGSFNNWGSNVNSHIAINDPSRMTWVDSLGCFLKTVQLEAGKQYQYKLYEHFNESGSSYKDAWYTDPLNPLVNYADYNNSIINVAKVMIFQLQPKDNSIFSNQQPEIVAGIFTTESDSILLDQSKIFVDDSSPTTFDGYYLSDASLLLYAIPQLTDGAHQVIIHVATGSGEFTADTTHYIIENKSPMIAELPEGVIDGINYIDNSTVTLSLYAPDKRFVYVIGDFNDWQVDPDYYMNMTPDSSRFWLTLTDLQPDREYIFQYLVDGELRIADPYTEKVSDPWNDPNVNDPLYNPATYPNLIAYPDDKTNEIASILHIDQEEYAWDVSNFERPPVTDLVIYELLIRDFIKAHDYKTLLDTLSYLENLGITAIELMPVNEFEGNESWGYNPSFYFAPDKYYGPKNDLKRFIDECHKRGIAVILDMVLNHSFGQSPLVRLYSDGTYGPPTSENPWYNVTATHPYSVGYDFNHESLLTQAFVDRVNAFWLTEYNVDGFRFDLSKGFTQKKSGSDVNAWSQYDESRIRLLKRMADRIREVAADAYIILEHFAEISEEKELANYGMLLWKNMNSAYSQSAMGWLNDSGRSSDLSGAYFRSYGWTKPHYVAYMESHDEPWLMYKNRLYGRSNTTYDIKDIHTGLDRIKLVSAFFFTIPGPKMMGQFGELGYDQNLPESGYERTARKPILWNYFQEPARLDVYQTIANLIHLRNTHEIFRHVNTQLDMRVGQNQYDRRLKLSLYNMHVVVIGNFGVATRSVSPQFHSAGRWYDYFADDSLTVTSTDTAIVLAPSEFRIYSDFRLTAPKFPTRVITTTTPSISDYVLEQNYPNPFNPETTIRYSLPATSDVRLNIYNMLGQEVKTLVRQQQASGSHQIKWDGTDNLGKLLASGLYFYRLDTDGNVNIKKMMLIR